ncbi:hypothetical protein NW768_002615 [Fusarium equiseti]|uniref:Uncharacterized protein n=1 Tax=Fusarium equiseti TaxID=61235 RepID=A0ABQ8RNV6_FUSEQ|nr:hypothetical protein NW768_002615 [Fusarium equiseti]
MIHAASVCEDLGWGRHDVGSETFLGIEREYAKVLPVFTRHVFETERLRKEWRDQKGTGLLSLLQEFSGRKATDDRDKVFALLGLASDIKTIEPNYSLSTVQVYRRTIIDLINHSGSLAALFGDMKRKNSGGIPTWIPDWSVAIEEPDRRRMQIEELRKVPPRWKVEVVDREHKYWELVAKNMSKLHDEIEAGKRKRLPKYIVDGLVSYQRILGTTVYGTAWKNDQNLDLLEQEAIRLCKSMYTECREDSLRFWSTTPIRRFIDAHLSLPYIPPSGDWYRLDIIRWCANAYGLRTLDLWFQMLQKVEMERYKTNHLHSLLSQGQKRDIVWDHNWYFRPDDIIRNRWSWDEYTRKTVPALIELIRDRLIAKAETNAEERTRLESLASEATNFLHGRAILPDYLTFHEAAIEAEELETLSGLIYLASEVLNVQTRSKTVLAVELTKHACGALINLHHNSNFNEPDVEYIDPFSTSVAFVGSAKWMRWLRDNGPQKFNFDHEQFLESRRLKQHKSLDESESILHISSTALTMVQRCSEKLITWVDSASRILTISQWALCALRSDRQDFILPFATTLVGGLYEESPGVFRRLRQPEDTDPLRSWFVSSLLPKLCKANPDVESHLRKCFADWRSEGKVRSEIKKSFDAEMRLATEGRVFFYTIDYRLGLGPASMMTGDEIRILPGANRPFVLRRHGFGIEYELIGDCYLLGHGKIDTSRYDSLQGSLPVEILGGIVFENFDFSGITLC